MHSSGKNSQLTVRKTIRQLHNHASFFIEALTTSSATMKSFFILLLFVPFLVLCALSTGAASLYSLDPVSAGAPSVATPSVGAPSIGAPSIGAVSVGAHSSRSHSIGAHAFGSHVVDSRLPSDVSSSSRGPPSDGLKPSTGPIPSDEPPKNPSTHHIRRRRLSIPSDETRFIRGS